MSVALRCAPKARELAVKRHRVAVQLGAELFEAASERQHRDRVPRESERQPTARLSSLTGSKGSRCVVVFVVLVLVVVIVRSVCPVSLALVCVEGAAPTARVGQLARRSRRLDVTRTPGSREGP